MAPKLNKKNDKNKRLRKNKPDSDSESSGYESEETLYETASDTDSTYTPPKKTKKSKRVIEESSESEAAEELEEGEITPSVRYTQANEETKEQE
jgi:hypothetical protein